MLLLVPPRRPCTRADAWKISERGAPSARPYLRLVDKWSKKRLAQLERITADVIRTVGEPEGPDGELSPSQVRRAVTMIERELRKPPPPTPTEKQIADVGRPDAKRAVAAEHRSLVAAGMPRGALISAVERTQRDRGDSRRADDTTSWLQRGIDILMSGIGEPLLQGWATDGADLIRTMMPLQARSTVPLVVEAVVQGRRWESLTDAMMRLGARSRAGARLIARDQTARLNGQITESMHKAAGVEEYVWLTSNDERVRESHRAVDGDRFRWDGPGAPNVGFYGESAHAGQAGACRCRARPVPPPGNAWAERPVRKPTYRPVARAA